MKLHVTIALAAILFSTFQAAGQTADRVTPDWITTANQPCKIWIPEPQPDESVTWSGACKDGLATGKGILRWTENGKPDVEFDGQYANGKRNGYGVMIAPDGKRAEGVWVNDRLVTTDEPPI